MDFNAFITENYIVLIIVGVVLVMTLIGYIAQKNEFGQKVSNKNKKKRMAKDTIKNDNVELLDENLDIISEPIIENKNTDGLSNVELKKEEPDILDTIAPDFNDTGLVMGDVNQNPEKTNEELGIPDELYAPFGDTSSNATNSIENLKIEDVATDDFSIVEKDNKNTDDDELIIKDINESLDNPESFENSFDNAELKIEEVQSQPIIDEVKEIEDPVKEEISDLVDNTFVINDGTNDFNSEPIEETVVEENNTDDELNIPQVETQNIESDNIDSSTEKTTNLKLDEINEKIKNLKLEDLENLNFEEDFSTDLKQNKKNKKVSIKSIDEIKKETNQNDVTQELKLPDLEQMAKNDTKVNESDDIWNF